MVLNFTLKDESTLQITNNEIISSSYKSDSSSSNEIQFGFASSAGLDFSIIDLEGDYTSVDFDGATIEMYNDAETIKKGIFIVKSVSRRKEIINISSLDYMSKFDKRFIDNLWSGTVGELLTKICTDCDVTMGDSCTDFLHSDIVLPNSDPFINMNCREILQAICECAGCFAIIDSDGELQLKWFNLSVVKERIAYSALKDVEINDAENNITDVSGVIGGLEFKTYDSEPEGYEIIIGNNNPIIYNHNYEETQAIFDEIKTERLVDFNYYTLDLQTRTIWDLEVGDTIEVQNKNNSYYKAIVTNIEYANDCNMYIVSSGENHDRNYNSINNKDSEAYGGTLIFGLNKDTDGEYFIKIKDINPSSQAYLNISDTSLNGSVVIELEGTTLKTLTNNGFTSYGFVVNLETTMQENILKITGTGVSDLEISLILVNCSAEETEEPVPEYVVINRENVHDTLLLNIVEIQEQSLGGGGYVE